MTLLTFDQGVCLSKLLYFTTNLLGRKVSDSQYTHLLVIYIIVLQRNVCFLVGAFQKNYYNSKFFVRGQSHIDWFTFTIFAARCIRTFDVISEVNCVLLRRFGKALPLVPACYFRTFDVISEVNKNFAFFEP